jgi:succinate dehydrogenase/fumarate reductase cytochrome b subunit
MIFINLKRAFIAVLLITTIGLNTNSLAQNNPAPAAPSSQTQTALYEQVKNVIFENIANIAVFILAPIGVLMIVINIILILWALIAGEQGKVGSKIAAIMIGFIMVVIGLGIATNKEKIFKTSNINSTLVAKL